MAHTILVADDEATIRSLLQDFFTSMGYHVFVTADGQQALEVAIREEPDVILLDVVMPGMNGDEICKALRANDRTKLIPVIMMTGFAGAVIEASQNAPDDLVMKPFRLSDLATRVKSIIPIRHMANRLERMLAYLDELDKNHPKCD
jgi:DNA-binding response OmpR family regulator